MELPDFHIPHAEKIAWMVDTRGWALEPVPPRTDTDPPLAGYAYTIGFPEFFEFPEVVVFGLTPATSNGMIELVADVLGAGTEIPLGVPLTGLFDGEQRCLFLPLAEAVVHELLPTALAWRKGRPFTAVQLLWPDRNGFLPTEAGFDRRVATAQPVLADLDGA